MKSVSAGRTLVVMMWVVALLGVFWAGCGNTGDVGAVHIGSDAGSEDMASIIIADLPQTDFPQTNLVSVSDTGSRDDGSTDAAGYELAPGSITTCGQFFECVQDCRADHDSCMGPCNDAMTQDAAAMVQRFMNCVSRNGCRNGGCVSQRCAQETQACFASPY